LQIISALCHADKATLMISAVRRSDRFCGETRRISVGRYFREPRYFATIPV
jgi:hypothetical protein